MTTGDASQTTPEQIMYVFLLFYTNCVHAILIPIITYWCVLNYSYITSMSRILLLLHETKGQGRVLIRVLVI